MKFGLWRGNESAGLWSFNVFHLEIFTRWRLGFLFFFLLLSTVTAFGDLAMADHGLIYSNGICTSSERVLFAF